MKHLLTTNHLAAVAAVLILNRLKMMQNWLLKTLPLIMSDLVNAVGAHLSLHPLLVVCSSRNSLLFYSFPFVRFRSRDYAPSQECTR